MLNLRSFSEILEDLHSPANENSQGFSSGWESHLEASNLSQIFQMMSESNSVTGPRVGVQKAYPIKKTPKVHIRRPSHKLSELQLSALSLLQTYCPALADNFTFQELKTAYRQSVLKTHPDQGGNSESFQEVKKSHHILLALFPGLS